MFYTNLGKERLQQNLKQMYNNTPVIDIQAINGLNKAEELGLLDYDATDIEKGRKAMPIGAKAVWGGVSYLKTAQGWKPVGKHRGNVKDNHDLIHNNDDKDKDHHAMVMDAGKMDEKEWTAKHGSNLHSKYKQVHEYLHKEKESKPENTDEHAGLTAQEKNGVKAAEHIKKLAGEAKSAMDRFLERKKLTIEDYNKMDKKDQEKLNEEWRNSPEYSDTDIKEKESKPKEEKKEEKPAEAKPEAKKEEPKVEAKKEETKPTPANTKENKEESGFSKPVLSKDHPIEVHAPALGHLPAMEYTLKYDKSNFMFDVYHEGKKKGVMNEKQVLSNLDNGHFKLKDTPAEKKVEEKVANIEKDSKFAGTIPNEDMKPATTTEVKEQKELMEGDTVTYTGNGKKGEVIRKHGEKYVVKFGADSFDIFDGEDLKFESSKQPKAKKEESDKPLKNVVWGGKSVTLYPVNAEEVRNIFKENGVKAHWCRQEGKGLNLVIDANDKDKAVKVLDNLSMVTSFGKKASETIPDKVVTGRFQFATLYRTDKQPETDPTEPKKEQPKEEPAAEAPKADDKSVIQRLSKVNSELSAIQKEHGSFSKMPKERVAELQEKYKDVPELNKKAATIRKNLKVEFTKDNNIIHDGKVIGSIVPSKNVNGYRVEDLKGNKITHFENVHKPDMMDHVKDLIITDKDKFSDHGITYENGEYKKGSFKSKNFNIVNSYA
jgi:hypothetical protein